MKRLILVLLVMVIMAGKGSGQVPGWFVEAGGGNGLVTSSMSLAYPDEDTVGIFDIKGIVLLHVIVGVNESELPAAAYKMIFRHVSGANSTALSDSSADMTGLAVGGLITITGTFANAAVVSAATVQAVANPSATKILLKSGNLVVGSLGQQTAKTISWHCVWTPVTRGSRVTARIAAPE